MIGDKITINGQEWEEISGIEYDKVDCCEDCMKMEYFDGYVYYKKLIKEVFPKVFEGDCYNFRINKILSLGEEE
jgi:hypothetical protein